MANEDMFENETNTSSNNEFDFSEQELTPAYVSAPKVGEETGWLVIKDCVKNTDVNKKKKDGKAFSIALAGEDYCMLIKTDKGDYNVGNWEVFGKVKSGLLQLAKIKDISFKAIATSGKVKVNVAHNYSGMDHGNQEAVKAKEEKRLYTVELEYDEKNYEVMGDSTLKER